MQRADAYPTAPNAHGDESPHAYSESEHHMDKHTNGDEYGDPYNGVRYVYTDEFFNQYFNFDNDAIADPLSHVHAERDIDADADQCAADTVNRRADVGRSVEVASPGEQMTPPPPVHNHPLEMQIYQTVSTYPLLPINEDAAIYRYAQSHGLGHPQMSEQEVMWGGDVYVFQTYQRGTVYVKKGEWDAITYLAKVE